MSFQRICRLAELTVGQGREFLVHGRVVALFRTTDRLFAVDGMCAHQGGPLAQGQLDGNCLTCPWHGWQYDIGSGINLLTGKRMIDCFPIEVREDEVWIDVTEILHDQV